MKDEAGSNLSTEENDFMLENSYADDNAENVPSYDAKAANDDQIYSSIIFDDLFVENNGGMSEHDLNAHNEYHEIQMLAYSVQREAGNKKCLNNELKKQKDLLQQELETSRLGYQNPERPKKAIAAQLKLYNCDSLHSANLIIDSPDSEETLEDAEESRLKMRNKMVQINYSKLNALYEIFVPQQEFSAEQTYFSIPFTSNNGSESKEVTSKLPILKMPKESILLNMFETIGVEINGLQTRIDKTLLEDRERRWMSDSQNSLRDVESSNSVRRPKSKDTKSKNRVLKNTNAKSSTAHVWKMSRSASIDSNKRETKHSNVCQSNTSEFKYQRLKNAINDGDLTLRFRNDHFAAITGYGYYVQGNLTICHVYYIEGLDHNLFLVRQFCDGDLEVAFRSNTCYV
ncbi:hypothetical protein Tco_0327387 [Tanacetum coccineum]